MYFKKLHLVGFKSFADKTEFLFEPGVTAIVGPNGCGKSNIADAIKWVLGEQSAKELRGGRMEDVIFNGAGNRPPLGMAEVALTLSNESKFLPVDYSEVTITRRLFRSGESDYLLNNTPVRLRDILDLLMGTGIGTSAYSLIEQGRIDQVLSARPEDRREIFEEASGISKYKAQKREASRKLEQTEQNLLRLVDILTEVKRQLAAVDRHAQRAERYKTEWETLKALDLRLAARQGALLEVEAQALAARLVALAAEEAALVAERDAAEQALESLRHEQEVIETSYRAAEVEVSSLVGRRDQIAEQRRWNESGIAESRSRCAAITHEVEALEQRVASHEERLRQCVQERERLVAEQQRLGASLAAHQAQMQRMAQAVRDAEAGMQAAKMEALDAKSRQVRTRNALTEATVAAQTLQARLRRLESEQADVTREAESVHQEAQRGAAELEQLRVALQEVEARRADVAAQIGAAEEERRQLEQRADQWRQERQIVQARLETLEDLQRRHEGLAHGAKSLLEAGLPEVCGAIAELCEVRPEWECAVEALLGDRLHAVIVETDAAALSALRHLRERGLGTATVISLERAARAARAAASRAASGAMVAGSQRLLEGLTVPDRYRPVLEWLLADAYVVERLDEALALADRLMCSRATATVATLGGESVDGASVSGGSVRTADETMVLGRERRIRDLRDRLAQAAQRVAQAEAALTAARQQLTALSAEQAHVAEVRHMTEVKQAEMMSRQESLTSQERQFTEELSTLALEITELAASRAELQERQMALEADATAAAQQEADCHRRIAQLQEAIEAHQVHRESARVAAAQQEAALTALTDQLAQVAQTESVVQESLAADRQRIEQARAQTHDEEAKQQRLQEELGRLEQELASLARQQEAAEARRAEIEAQHRAHRQRFDAQQAASRTVAERVDELREVRSQAQVAQETLSARRQQVEDRIRLTYQLTLAQAEVEPMPDEEAADAAARVERLRTKVAAMGPVNLVAIEERQALQERLQFLTTQHEDLERSKADLHRAILEINKTTRTLFRETFDQITVEFQRYFQLLFGGGEARLVLVNQDDVLESGIELVVSPPGKRLQHLTLLSGGEKAMTAIALLFAVFRVKPSPFCILDEIDAALDEANVARFARVLDEFVHGSQFIVITHNKKTIGSADILYGVTMAERGVSQVVSVRMAAQPEAVAVG